MKVAAISDMHGLLDFAVESSDILVICGDIMPLKIQHYHKPSQKWFSEVFIPWCQNQPVEEIYLVGGNHDQWIYSHPDEVREALKGTNIHYLCDETARFIDENGKDFLIYGTPWCHQFGNWYFMGYSDEGLKEIFRKMPKGIDVLITHDPPYGNNDISEESFYDNTSHLGNIALSEVIQEKQPRYVFSGHIHTGSKEFTTKGDIKICNVSVVDETYKLRYPPKYVEID